MIYRIDPDGTRSTHTPKGKRWTLEELQSLVGGYIEAISLPSGNVALMDEDGRMRRLPLNPTASALVGRALVGPIVIGPASILS
jgi:hypothetical protein